MNPFDRRHQQIFMFEATQSGGKQTGISYFLQTISTNAKLKMCYLSNKDQDTERNKVVQWPINT